VTALTIIGVWLRRFPPTVDATVTLGYTFLAGLFASVLSLLLDSPAGSRLDRALSVPTLRFFGRYSYALYVFHHPVVLWMRETPLNVSRLPLILGSRLPAQALYFMTCLGISLGLALLSWHLIEAPFLRLKKRFPYEARERVVG
jgi:peptidoglycan/LPS O-acetylase OafA/YrhL